jgi:hypothetical protein
MLHTNYKNLFNSILEKNKGFWRLEAIAILTKKIQKGEEKYNYLRNLISLHNKRTKVHPFLQINSLSPKNEIPKKLKKVQSFRNRASQVFFVTQVPAKKKFQYQQNPFMNEEEEKIYNHIEIHPFEINNIRRRDKNQIYYNTQEIKKEIETSYNYIRKEQIKDRPFTSYYKRKLSKNYFGYNFFSNNMNMSKKRKSGYNKNYHTSYTNNNYSESIENWTKLGDKRRIVSAYLNNKDKRNLFGEDNLLFEDIKKNSRNKNKYFNLLTKNKSINNHSTITDNIMNSISTFEQRDGTIINIKGKMNKKIFGTINADNK